MGYACTVSAISLTKFSQYSNHLPHNSKNYRSLPSSLGPRRISIRNPKSSKLRFVVLAEEGGKNNNGEDPEQQQEGDVKGGERRRPPPALNLRWRDVLDPDPENIVAIGLTGLLTWASVQFLRKGHIPEKHPINFDHLRATAFYADFRDLSVISCLLRSAPNLVALELRKVYG